MAFSYGGFMAAQSVHIDVVEAGAWLPWAFAALDRLAHRDEGRSAGPWVGILGASIGLMGLSGAAEPILDGGLVLGVYALWLWWRNPGRRWSFLGTVVAGVVLGLALAGAQLVPGALIQEQSQRAVHNYQFFTSGSMNKSLTVLGLDPLLLGASGSFPLHFFGTYSLTEVSSYIGIMPLMGVVGLLARRWRRLAEARRWWIWYGVLALGLVVTWGGFTPLGHVFFHIPLFNRQRLLARNLLEVDLAVAVLFATWLDVMLLARPARAGATGSADVDDEGPPAGPPAGGGGAVGWWRRLPGPRGWRSDVVLPLVPPALVIALQVVLLVGGTWLPHFMHVPGHLTRSTLWPLVVFLTLPSAIAAYAMWLVLHRRQLARLMPRLLTVVVLVDLALFNGFTQGSPDPDGATTNSATANTLAAFVAAHSPGPPTEQRRMALFDPDRYYNTQAEAMGQPDLTILRSLSSVQGYGAVVDRNYDSATDTHTQLDILPSALADGTFAQLNLGVLATVPEYFVHLVGAPPGLPTSIVTGTTRIPPVGPTPNAPVDDTPPPPTSDANYQQSPAPAAVVSLGAGRARTQYFGTVLAVTAVSVPVRSGSGTLRVGLLSPDGTATRWIGAPAARRGTETVRPPAPTAASGIVLEAVAEPASGPLPGASATPAPVRPVRVEAAVVRTEGQGTYRVDGSLRDAVTPGRWRYAGMLGPFSLFTEASAGSAWVQGGAAVRSRWCRARRGGTRPSAS